MLRITRSIYAGIWKNESDGLNKAEVYKNLAALTPEGNVLEFGCGSGLSTGHLLANHNVLSLENNTQLIAYAKEHLIAKGFEPNILECNFFSLSEDDKKAISEFAPEVIVGWFIGGSGDDQIEQFPAESDPRNMMKLYREKIEDIIVSPDVCTSSVEYIQVANRGMGIVGADPQEMFNDQKADYDLHVFSPNGFEVVKVDTFTWAADKSQFPYQQVHNPNFNGGKPTEVEPLIFSIIAKRVSQ